MVHVGTRRLELTDPILDEKFDKKSNANTSFSNALRVYYKKKFLFGCVKENVHMSMSLHTLLRINGTRARGIYETYLTEFAPNVPKGSSSSLISLLVL